MQQEISNLIKYQRVEAELVKIDKALEANPNKVTLNKMAEVFNSSLKLAETLEKDAEKAVSEFEKVKKNYAQNYEKAQKFATLDLDKLNEDQLNKVNSELETIVKNLDVIEKNLLSLNKGVDAILEKFETAKKNAVIARTNYAKAKENFEKVVSSNSSNRNAIVSELKKTEPMLNKTLFAKYKSLRDGKIFPVLVPLQNGLCGACRMKPPIFAMQKLNSQGFVECENCHRIIYTEA